MKHRIIVATGNAGKMREFRMILEDLGLEIISMKEAGVSLDIVEDGSTFAENAEIKARAVWALTGDIVLADDSGLVVDYLNGEPGIYSARYMGEETVEGMIAHHPAGSNGFGYDPIFYLPEYGMTSAEIPLDRKNEISHRGKALEAMKLCLRDAVGREEQ